MKKGHLYEGRIERLDFPNKGICYVEDTRVTVKNTLPGQRVRFAVTKLHKGKAEGRLTEVLERSPKETRPIDCAHFGICGSCVYRSLPYEEQLALKGEQVKALLFPAAGEFPFEGVLPSPVSCGYRNKMEFSFGDEEKDGPLTLGMHKRGSFYDVVTAADCKIVDEDFREILKTVLAYFAERKVPYYRKNHVGFLRHLLVRKAAKTKEILVALVTSTQAPAEWDGADFAARVRRISLSGHLTGILHIWNDSLADVVQSDRTDLLWGRDWIEEELLGLAFKITPFSFFQTNSLGAEVLYETVRRYVAEAVGEANRTDCGGRGNDSRNPEGKSGGHKENLPAKLDIRGENRMISGQDGEAGADSMPQMGICGGNSADFIGNMIESGETIDNFDGKTAVDGDKRNELISRREEREGSVLDLTGFTVFDLYSGTGTIAQLLAETAGKVIGVELVEEAVEAARENAAANGLTNCEFIAGDVLKVLDSVPEKPDLIVLDPPRDGIHPKALPKILAYGVEHMVYISCKPTSLARDLPVILAAGYRVVKGCSVDMFPDTSGVESIVLLSKLHTKQNIEVELEMSELDLTAAESKATYAEIKNKEIIPFSYTKRNEYSEILKAVYDYACGKNANDTLIVGNLMRRVMEAFSTFVYKKGIAEISCDDTILQQIGDKDYIDYFKNLMYRLVLNGDSHMLERTNSLDDMDYLNFLSDEERRRTAQEVICFIYLLNKRHVLAHLEGKQNIETNIQKWCADIKSFCADDEVTV